MVIQLAALRLKPHLFASGVCVHQYDSFSQKRNLWIEILTLVRMLSESIKINLLFLGMKDGQKITFHGEGDQEPGLEPGDIIIVLDQKDHAVFTR